MTDLFVGDLHLNDTARDAYRHNFQWWLLDQVKKIKPRRVIFVGDFTDAKDQHRAWLVNKIAGYFDRLSRETDIVALMGNHDYLDPDNPFFAFLSHIPGITWVMRPKAIDGWLFLPHTRDYERDWKGLELAKYQLIITHNTFTGADNGFGKRLRGIPIEIIPKTCKVIAGDVHFPQNNGNITYIGAPYIVNFGDQYDPRILRLDGMKFSDIDVPGPKKLVVNMTALDRNGKGTYNFDIPHTYDNLIEPGDILELRVSITPDHRADWQEIRTYLRDVMSHQGKCIVYSVKPIMESKRKSLKAVTKQHKRSDGELIKLYGSRSNLDKATLSFGLNLAE